MVMGDQPALLEAALALDEKLRALVVRAASEGEPREGGR